MSSAAEGLTVPGLDGAAVIVTGGSGVGAATARPPRPAPSGQSVYGMTRSALGAVIPLDGGQVIDRE